MALPFLGLSGYAFWELFHGRVKSFSDTAWFATSAMSPLAAFVGGNMGVRLLNRRTYDSKAWERIQNCCQKI